MARPKGAKNKKSLVLPYYSSLAPKERVQFLAGLIVDRILEDEQSGGKLLKMAAGQSYAKPIHT